MIAETNIALQLCRTPLPEANLARARAAMEGPVSFDRLLGLARAWQVEPLVMGNLHQHFATSLSPDDLARARESARDSKALALGHTLGLVDVVREFTDRRLPVIVLKGPAIGVTGYGDPSLRPFADFDLLVRREDIGRARDITLSLGYTRDYLPEAEEELIRKRHALEFSRMSTKIELHCSLLSRHLRFAFDTTDLWRESVTIGCGGGEIRILAPHHQFLFACAHGAKHRWASPHWICDIAQLADRMNDDDRDRVLELADMLHGKRILAIAIRIARDLVGLDRSRFPDATLSPVSETDDLVRQVRKQFFGNGSVSSPVSGEPGHDPNLALLRFWISARERWIDRTMSLLQVLFVPTEKDRAAGRAAWLVRPVRLGVVAARWATGLAHNAR